MAAFDEGLERITWLIGDAAGGGSAWRPQVSSVVLAVLQFLDDEPGWARLLIDESPTATAVIAQRRQHALAQLARALTNETRKHASNSDWFMPSCELTAELVIGGIFQALRAHLHGGSKTPFVELAPALIAFVEAAYQASGVVSEPLGRGVDAPALGGQRLPVRTTYRTTRVLCVIGDSSGLSNREIAEAAGLADEGQTSKLLRRLERRGLVENFGLGSPYGGANAWCLTAYGERVRDATRHSLVPGAGTVMKRRVRGAA